MGIKIKNLYKKFNGHTVLNNINISMDYGKIYGFQGRNGSGKTMLFRSLCGLIVPSSGEISIDEKVLHKNIRIPESIGVIIETPGFWNHYTGYENLKVLSLIKNKITDKEILEILHTVGLDDAANLKYKKYSLGMKQRLAIAQAIMESPKILLLDEPTNALDEEGVEMLRDILSDLRDKGTLIALASHSKEDINILSDVKILIDKGKIENVEK